MKKLKLMKMLSLKLKVLVGGMVVVVEVVEIAGNWE